MSIASGILDYLKSKKFSWVDPVAAECNGNNSKQRAKRVVTKLLEAHSQKPLMWFVCLLQANKLPLRHLTKYLNGKTGEMAILVDQIASRVSRYNDAQFKMVDNSQSLAIFNEGLLGGQFWI